MREAIIFVPGIGGEAIVQSCEGIATRICTAIDRQAVTEKATFNLEIKDEAYGGKFRTQVCTIMRRDPSSTQPSPILDVYRLDHHKTLVGEYEHLNVAMKALLVLLEIVRNGARTIASLFNPRQTAKGFREKLQWAYAMLMLLLMTLYFVLLAGAVLDLASQILPEQTPKRILELANEYKHAPTVLVVAFSVIGLFVPGSAQEAINAVARDYYCMTKYLNDGSRRASIVGQLEALLEHVVEKEAQYDRIHLVGYSFGSVELVDALFPQGREPGPRFERIHTLVTIACPFDLIRAFWPRYFTGRRVRPNVPARWINIYSVGDVLSSNFRDDNAITTATRSVQLENGTAPIPENIHVGLRETSFWDIFTFVGLRSHSTYWESGEGMEVSCFHDVVQRMYAGTGILA